MANYKLTPNLKAILKERGIKQIELSSDSGVPQPYISRFDNTEANFEISNLYSIAKSLGLSMDELFIIEELNTD
jgi:transcriptional regulator with XRE-family HTH domain